MSRRPTHVLSDHVPTGMVGTVGYDPVGYEIEFTHKAEKLFRLNAAETSATFRQLIDKVLKSAIESFRDFSVDHPAISDLGVGFTARPFRFKVNFTRERTEIAWILMDKQLKKVSFLTDAEHAKRYPNFTDRKGAPLQ